MVQLRYGDMYLANDGDHKSKFGVTLELSSGHVDRKQGKASATFYGCMHAVSFQCCVGECNARDAFIRLEVYEWTHRLGLAIFLIHLRYEARLTLCPPSPDQVHELTSPVLFLIRSCFRVLALLCCFAAHV